MIQLIYGEDDVGVDEALAELMGDAGPEDLRDINCSVLRAEDLSPNDVIAAAFTVPFMAERRVVVVKGLMSRFERGGRRRNSGDSNGSGRNPLGEWSDLIEQLPSMPPTTHLAFVDGPVARNNPLLRRLTPISESREFPLPRERDMPSWIAARATSLGIQIQPSACAVLADAVGRRPRLIDSELRKLAIFAEGRQVAVEDVREMVAYVREANIFQAVDAIVDRRTGPALQLVRRIVEDGSPVAYLMTMIARQVRLLLVAKDMQTQGLSRGDINQRLRLPGWVLDRTLTQAGRMSQAYLEYIHDQLVETDLKLKTTPIDEQLAVELLIAQLTTRRS